MHPKWRILVNSVWTCYVSDFTFVFILAGMVNISLLRTQQQRLAAMNACSVLFRHQNLLRHVLKHHTLGSSPSLEVLNEGEELDPVTETLLIQKLISKATQPSPLKATFGKNEIEVSSYWFWFLKRLHSCTIMYEILSIVLVLLWIVSEDEDWIPWLRAGPNCLPLGTW